MNWRDTLIGAAVTLLITVGSGLILFYLTYQPAAVPPSEHLIYTVDQGAAFETQATQINIITVRIANIGSKAARQVRCLVTFGTSANIEDKKVDFSSGAVGEMADRSKNNQIDFI